MPSLMGTLAIFLSLGIFSSCSSGKDEACNDKVDLSKISVNITVEDLTPKLLKLKNRQEAKAFLQKNQDFSKKFALSYRFTEDTIASTLVKFAEQPYMDTLYQHVKEVFGDYSQLKQELTDAFKHIKYYYPAFKIPKLKLVVTGVGSYFGRDIYVDDEVIFISLDYFLGKKYRYRPREPYYIARRYTPKYIVPAIVQFISRTYNKSDIFDRSLVAEMITYGKTLQFVKTMMPCAHDSLVTGFTTRQLANINDPDNKKVIWGHFVEKQVLFVKTPRRKKAYLGERPYTAEMGVGKECPGRIGWWVGWQIVKKFMRKFPDKTFQEVMAFDKQIHIFNSASYKGE